MRRAFTLPRNVLDAAGEEPQATMDVKITPARFVTIRELGGIELASCRLVRLGVSD